MVKFIIVRVILLTVESLISSLSHLASRSAMVAKSFNNKIITIYLKFEI